MLKGSKIAEILRCKVENLYFVIRGTIWGGVRGRQMPTPDFPGGPSFHHKGPFAGHNKPLCPT